MYDGWERVGLLNGDTIGHICASLLLREPQSGEQADRAPNLIERSQWLDLSLIRGSLPGSLEREQRIA